MNFPYPTKNDFFVNNNKHGTFCEEAQTHVCPDVDR